MGNDSIVARLRARGAAQIEHPGGTLLAHLIRVAESLKREGTAAWVVTAGLCHAAYGTAGFAPALFGLDERTLLASWIGSQAEELVYLYGACDRGEWTAEEGLPQVLRDRFDGALVTPPEDVRRALLEITIANELDVLAYAPLSDSGRAALRAFVDRCRWQLTPGRRLLVMFGLPGAGKTFVARRLASRGFHMHDGDDDLPADMREAIARAQPVTPPMRDRFMRALIDHVGMLRLSHPRLVVAQTFLKQSHRRQFAARFPDAEFVLVSAPQKTRAARLSRRKASPLDAAYVRKMVAAFDPPRPPYTRIVNGGDDARLERALARLLDDGARAVDVADRAPPNLSPDGAGEPQDR